MCAITHLLLDLAALAEDTPDRTSVRDGAHAYIPVGGPGGVIGDDPGF